MIPGCQGVMGDGFRWLGLAAPHEFHIFSRWLSWVVSNVETIMDYDHQLYIWVVFLRTNHQPTGIYHLSDLASASRRRWWLGDYWGSWHAIIAHTEPALLCHFLWSYVAADGNSTIFKMCLSSRLRLYLNANSDHIINPGLLNWGTVQYRMNCWQIALIQGRPFGMQS